MSQKNEARHGTTLAPEGQVWVCGACGKRSRTRYGWDAEGKNAFVDHGWDVSCAMHAVLCHDTVDGSFRPVKT